LTFEANNDIEITIEMTAGFDVSTLRIKQRAWVFSALERLT
jgi:hypothetical protein